MYDYLALLGPTGSGKSDLAISLGQRYPIEVISVDSVAVYKGFDIGSAKPTKAEMKGVAHHLIDVAEVPKIYTAADFVADANTLIQQIKARGNIPLLCGGTMMYAHAMQQGLTSIPKLKDSDKQKLEADVDHLGIAAVYAQLRLEDPLAASHINENDKQRIIRALSVIRQTGKSIITYWENDSQPKYKGCFVLQCINDRKAHRERLSHRVDKMLNLGLRKEVLGLIEKYGVDVLSHPAMRSIGYKQIADVDCEIMPAIDVREKIITASAQLVKKQMTWINAFKGEFYHRVEPYDAYELLEMLAKQALESSM